LAQPTVEDETEWNGVEVRGEMDVLDEVGYLEVSSSRLEQLRLTGRRFGKLRLVDVVLEDCDLSACTLEDASLIRVEFRRCRLSWLEGAGLRAEDVGLTDSKLDGANLRMSKWERASLEDCDLRGIDLHAAHLRFARLVRCNLAGAQFAKADMSGAALHGSKLEGIQGGESLRGVVIGSDQVMPLSTAVFGALSIAVDDDHPAAGSGRA
jgi:hypothetical protein